MRAYIYRFTVYNTVVSSARIINHFPFRERGIPSMEKERKREKEKKKTSAEEIMRFYESWNNNR